MLISKFISIPLIFYSFLWVFPTFLFPLIFYFYSFILFCWLLVFFLPNKLNGEIIFIHNNNKKAKGKPWVRNKQKEIFNEICKLKEYTKANKIPYNLEEIYKTHTNYFEKTKTQENIKWTPRKIHKKNKKTVTEK